MVSTKVLNAILWREWRTRGRRIKGGIGTATTRSCFFFRRYGCAKQLKCHEHALACTGHRVAAEN